MITKTCVNITVDTTVNSNHCFTFSLYLYKTHLAKLKNIPKLVCQRPVHTDTHDNTLIDKAELQHYTWGNPGATAVDLEKLHNKIKTSEQNKCRKQHKSINTIWLVP